MDIGSSATGASTNRSITNNVQTRPATTTASPSGAPQLPGSMQFPNSTHVPKITHPSPTIPHTPVAPLPQSANTTPAGPYPSRAPHPPIASTPITPSAPYRTVAPHPTNNSHPAARAMTVPNTAAAAAQYVQYQSAVPPHQNRPYYTPPYSNNPQNMNPAYTNVAVRSGMNPQMTTRPVAGNPAQPAQNYNPYAMSRHPSQQMYYPPFQ